jgi:hypothetical protein
MKKYILSLIVILLLMNFIEIQAQPRRSYWINAVAGLNSNWILNQNAYGNPEMEYATTFGPTGGVGVSYFYNRQWGYNGSVFLSKIGQNYAGDQAGAAATRKVKLTYLEVPLLIMAQVPNMQNSTWFAFGPDVMILINAKQDYSRDGGNSLPNPDGMATGNVKDRFKRADIALNISMNQMYNLNYSRRAMFLFSINSSVGITDINKPEWQIPNVHGIYGKSRNFYIGIKAGLMFKIARGKSRW